MLETLQLMLSYPFLRNALIVGPLVCLCAALLGVTLVLKRYAMIGDGLSHMGFGATCVATALGLDPLGFSLVIVVIAAFLLLRLSSDSKLGGDSAVAILSTGALALGVIVLSVSTGLNVDVANYLFGSILAVSAGDARISVSLSVAVLLVFILFYNKIFSVTFDESFAKATGTNTTGYNMLIALLTAVTIVAGMRLMGSMLISALVIFPALTAMRLCKGFRAVMLCAAAVSLLSFFAGIFLSYFRNWPPGASVVAVNLLFFLLSVLFRRIRKGAAGKGAAV